MFVERQIVSATVHAGLDQEQVPRTAASCGPTAPRNRIRHARIEVGQPVEALRPGPRNVPSNPQVQVQLIGYFPGVPAIKTPIELLPGNRTRDIHSTRCLVAQGGANPLAKAQNEGGEVVLCVFVRNRTLSLAVSYQSVRNGEIGRQGGSLYGGDCAVVRRRKTLLRNGEPGIVRCTEGAETAGAYDVPRKLRANPWGGINCKWVEDRRQPRSRKIEVGGRP